MHDKSSKRKTTSTATARATRCQADPAAVLEMQVDNVNAELRAHTLVQLNGRLSCLHCGLGGVGGNWNGNIEKSSHCAIQRHLKDYHCLSVVGKHTNRSIATDSPSPSVSPIQALQGFGATEQERIEIEYIQKPFEPAAAAWGYELRFQTGLEPPFFPGEAHLDFVSFVAKNKIRQELLRGEHDGYKNFPSLLNTVNGYLRFRFQCEWRLVRVQTSPTLSTASQVTTGSGLGSPHSSYSASPPHSIAPSIGNHDFVGSAVPNVSQGEIANPFPFSDSSTLCLKAPTSLSHRLSRWNLCQVAYRMLHRQRALFRLQLRVRMRVLALNCRAFWPTSGFRAVLLPT
ncbi:hypothetical protein DFJ73DRAFT_295515 [Zopfochytrium polystomum]|nr:hypothetical protein DFJ73DRAFT_295515 [Zopfochytrium polystomum]